MFSVQSLTEEQAEQIADAYIKGDRDPPRIALLLGVDRFDLNILMHPLVRGFVVRKQHAAAAEHDLGQHMQQLRKIRDAAFDDDNWKTALAAETQLGKVAGHYEPKLPDDQVPGQKLDPTKMSTEELRRRIASSVGAVIPQGEAPALPGSIEAQEVDEATDEI